MISLNLTDCPIPFYRFQTPLALTTIHLNRLAYTNLFSDRFHRTS